MGHGDSESEAIFRDFRRLTRAEQDGRGGIRLSWCNLAGPPAPREVPATPPHQTWPSGAAKPAVRDKGQPGVSPAVGTLLPKMPEGGQAVPPRDA